MRSVIRLYFTFFFLILTYAIIRYVILGGVELVQIPLYIINKAMAVTGFFLLLLSSANSFFKNKNSGFSNLVSNNKDLIGLGSFLFIFGHVFISVLILNPHYFAKFFSDTGKMNLTGELSMLFGVLGLILLWLTNRYFSFTPIDSNDSNRPGFKKLIHWAVISSTLHVIIMGIKSWIAPADWYGYLPPITLITFAGFLVWLFIMLKIKPAKNSVDI